MSTGTRIATYLPPWASTGNANARALGRDEDTITLAVAAGLAASNGAAASRVELVTRQPALLEGGSSAVICAALGLPNSTEVVERLGGAATALDALCSAPAGTLVIGVDTEGGAGAGAVLIGDNNPISLNARVQRSLPIKTKHTDGSVYEDDDARLVRERGTRASLDAAELPSKPTAIAGVSGREVKLFAQAGAPKLPTSGASSPFFALAAVSEIAGNGLVVAIDQAALTAATLDKPIEVERDEAAAQPIPLVTEHPGPDIKFTLTAYDRAFESKLRWQAGKCVDCGTLALPQRYRCIECGAEGTSELTPLPRTGEVYTDATIHVPVPNLATPYSLAIVQLDGVDVRSLVTVTDVPPATASIGDRGRLVLRRVAMRSGVPDYGYAFAPYQIVQDQPVNAETVKDSA